MAKLSLLTKEEELFLDDYQKQTYHHFRDILFYALLIEKLTKS